MKFRILLCASVTLISLGNAVSVDYYPQSHEHSPAIKYLEPAYTKAIKYVQSTPIPIVKQHNAPSPIPLLKHFAVTTPVPIVNHYQHHEPAPVNHYQHHEPAPINHYQHHEPAPINHYQHHEPAPINHYQHHQPASVKYVHQEPQILKYADPHPQYVKKIEYEDTPAHYEYAYDVHDDYTGDIKSHSEKRDGHSVVGSYTIMDPDGYKRIVDYTADEHNGFNAVVRREPVDVKIVKKVYDAEPGYIKPVANYITEQPHKHYVHAQPTYIQPPQTYISQPQPKYYSTPVHQKIIAPAAPLVKQITTPQYYAAPEHPKYYKPTEKVAKFIEPHHTALKYVQSTPVYDQY